MPTSTFVWDSTIFQSYRLVGKNNETECKLSSLILISLWKNLGKEKKNSRSLSNGVIMLCMWNKQWQYNNPGGSSPLRIIKNTMAEITNNVSSFSSMGPPKLADGFAATLLPCPSRKRSQLLPDSTRSTKNSLHVNCMTWTILRWARLCYPWSYY